MLVTRLDCWCKSRHQHHILVAYDVGDRSELGDRSEQSISHSRYPRASGGTRNFNIIESFLGNEVNWFMQISNLTHF